MARAYSDDLRRRILQAYEQGEGSEARLAQRFPVSLSYVKKIRRQLRHTGKMERVAIIPDVHTQVHRARAPAAASLAGAAARLDASRTAGATPATKAVVGESALAVDGAAKNRDAS
jgi:transposase-like protein